MIRLFIIGLMALVILDLITDVETTVEPNSSQTGGVTKAADTLAFKTSFDP